MERRQRRVNKADEEKRRQVNRINEERRKLRRRKKAFARAIRTTILMGLMFIIGFFLGGFQKETKAGISPEQNIAGQMQTEQNGINKADMAQKDGTEADWRLTLVNKWNQMESHYIPALKTVGKGYSVDERIADELLEMLEAAKKDGVEILITSAYRTQDKQKNLYEKKVRYYTRKGYSDADARAEAGKTVAVPGTSEHQLGLAVDLVSSEYRSLDEKQEKTKGYQWLLKHCAEYGFILRYPNGKTDITGIIYEPWHFRYVGREIAKEIMDQGITLEEYLE